MSDESPLWFILPREGKPCCYDVNQELLGRIRDISRAHICDSGGVCRKCGAVMPTVSCPVAHQLTRSVAGKTAMNYICRFKDMAGDRIVVTLFFQKKGKGLYQR